MTNPMTAGLRPTHPGELLREDVLPAVKLPKTEIARLLGMSRQNLYEILDGKKPVTVPTALRLAKLFGGSPETWLRMQAAFDLRRAGEAMADELAALPVLENA